MGLFFEFSRLYFIIVGDDEISTQIVLNDRANWRLRNLEETRIARLQLQHLLVFFAWQKRGDIIILNARRRYIKRTFIRNSTEIPILFFQVGACVSLLSCEKVLIHLFSSLLHRGLNHCVHVWWIKHFDWLVSILFFMIIASEGLLKYQILICWYKNSHYTNK